ncbi:MULTISPECIES: aromatic acid exporter family protein [Oceanobacillus]|nr:aromatic acid exporter family protein [Oceanobacillus profundus]MBR3120071.1 aromatic acid exporter family protein [Oceanobacillus sp.]MDO6447938.1 aromatic acid exporter family protein [Oceanobacillus profundus]
MVGMGYRTIKTAIGAGLAIWIASLIELEFATFAAIIVIMCIETTKKRTLNTIKEKFFASLLSIIIGMLFFELLGYNPISFALFILLFVPILLRARIQNGFITSMVVVLHIYTVQEASLETFLNELYIILIGMGIAILVNSIMPSFKKNINKNMFEIGERFSVILYELAAYLRDNERQWDGKEIIEAEEIIHKSKSIVIQDVENHLFRAENKDYHYLQMRGDQLEILKKMVTIVHIISSSDLHVKQRGMLADFFEYVSQNVHSGDTIHSALERLENYEASIRETELPKTREEFEVRANLFYLNFEIKNYLTIKKKVFEVID